MAAFCPDFKWLGLRISDPIQDYLKPNLFSTIQNLYFRSPLYWTRLLFRSRICKKHFFKFVPEMYDVLWLWQIWLRNDGVFWDWGWNHGSLFFHQGWSGLGCRGQICDWLAWKINVALVVQNKSCYTLKPFFYNSLMCLNSHLQCTKRL